MSAASPLHGDVLGPVGPSLARVGGIDPTDSDLTSVTDMLVLSVLCGLRGSPGGMAFTVLVCTTVTLDVLALVVVTSRSH